MVYKSSVKDYAIMCCFSGLFYGFSMGLYWQDMFMGIIAGVLFGVLFTLCMSLFSKHIEKKIKPLREQISKDRKIICEGSANHKKGTNAIGGWMFVIEDTIEFYPHKVNIGGQNVSISIHDIINIETKSNQLIINTKLGKTFVFVVSKANLWKQSISEIL